MNAGEVIIDPYADGYKAYGDGAPRKAPKRVVQNRRERRELWLMGFDEAQKDRVPRREKVKVTGQVDQRSKWKQRLEVK